MALKAGFNQFVLASILLAPVAIGHAAIIDTIVHTEVTILQYRSGVGVITGRSTHTQLGGSTSRSELRNNEGSGTAIANLSGPNLLPSLQVHSNSGEPLPDQSLTESFAWGSLSYIYNGAASTGISLDIVLVGGISGGDALARSDVAIILGDVNSPTTSFSTLLDEVLQNPAISLLGRSSLTASINSPLLLMDSIDFELDPGDRFYVASQLFADSVEPGDGDATSSLTMSFSDSTGIAKAVPEPGTLGLLAAGVLGLAFARRRTA